MKMKKYSFITVVALFLQITCTVLSFAGEPPVLTTGEQVYVPAYSYIYISNREQKFKLTITLSIRNIDPKHAITIESVNYFNTNGKLITKYLAHKVTLNAFQATHFIVPQKDESGGAGAHFLVVWKSLKPVNSPLIETVMIGAEGQQGISFTSRGIPIRIPY